MYKVSSVLLFMSIATTVYSDPIEEEEFSMYQNAAQGGNRAAQFKLGHIYKEGLLGIPKNWQEATKWLLKAAEKEHITAQLHLAEIYEQGEDGFQNYSESVKWYKTAAEKENLNAQFKLGYIYKEGLLGRPKNWQEAKKWLLKAAEKKDAIAQLYLAEIYELGGDDVKDLSESVRWYKSAAANENLNAQIKLGCIYKEGLLGVSKNWQEAKKWLLKAAAKEDNTAQLYLAEICELGGDDVKDLSEAARWYKSAITMGNVAAQFNLGMMFYDGYGVTQSFTEAINLIRQAAENGFANAQAQLGVMYGRGEGISQSNTEALKWYRLAADQSHGTAQYNLGWMYENGKGVDKSLTEAIKWYNLAAQNNQLNAQHRLSELEQDMSFRIRSENDWFYTGISIDGGGMRGIIPAVMMTRIEEVTRYPIHKLFDTVTGTSIGGILALGVAGTLDGYTPIVSPAQGVDLFKNYGKEIFSSSLCENIWSGFGWMKTRYNPRGIENVLFRFLGNSKLSQTLTHVTVTGVHHGWDRAIKFDSLSASRDTRYDFYLRDIGRATSAAPTYFPAATISNINGTEIYTIIDGGVGQNNPVRLADDYLRTLDTGNHSSILSLGTGELTSSYIPSTHAGNIHWGWNGAILNTMMESASDFSHYGIDSLANAGVLHYNRFQPTLYCTNASLDNFEPSLLLTYEDAAHNAHDWENSEYLRWLAENTARKHPSSF